ncbi:hypothetical protein ABI59_15795 [Acidobacteria bacterium Mor1]|nr:hypothetical protein ABI59_15795 [Acidobacteria bacterium Mor1]
MSRLQKTTVAIVVMALLATPALATTRDAANASAFQFQFNQSVLRDTSGGILFNIFDEAQKRPWNLPNGNVDSLRQLSPWKGDAGENGNYLNFLVGNGGVNAAGNQLNTIFTDGGGFNFSEAGTFAGGFVNQTENFTYSFDIGLLTDEHNDINESGSFTSNFGTDINGLGLGISVGWELNDKWNLGGRLEYNDQEISSNSMNFTTGSGGSRSDFGQEADGIKLKFGGRNFISDDRSFDVALSYATGDMGVFDRFESLDASMNVVSSSISDNINLSNDTIGLHGAYNQRYNNGELRIFGGYYMTERSFDNNDLEFTTSGGTVTPERTLLGSDDITWDQFMVGAEGLCSHGTSDFFFGASLALNDQDGSTTVDNFGTVTTESIDDSSTQLDLVVGYREHLTDNFRAVAFAHGVYNDGSFEDVFTTTGTSRDEEEWTTTTTRYGIGLEWVRGNLNLMLSYTELAGANDITIIDGLPITTAFSGGRTGIDTSDLTVSATLHW